MLSHIRRISLQELVLFSIAVLLTAFTIFFTPLRYNILVEPKIKSVDPESIYVNMNLNPEKYLFIDVRSITDYQKFHAKGSVCIPIAQLYYKWRELPR